mgnify:CR=1 FL=1
MTKRYALTTLLLYIAAVIYGQGGSCPLQHIDVERLPDLNIPRAGHTTLFAGGELFVAGGHTAGFVPTATAEYFRDGQWHLLSTVYTHDNAFSVPLRSGKVLLAGGHLQDLGIGQTHVVEMYDPAPHTFDGFGCLDTKRVMGTGVETDSGRVVIAGNWYHTDDIELYDGDRSFTHVKGVSSQRTHPFILRTARDNVMILGNTDTHGGTFSSTMADQLRGDPIELPLLEHWRTLRLNQADNHPDAFFIGDEAAGRYSYLLPLVNDSGQVAIARTEGTALTLLKTTVPVPMTCRYGDIFYDTPFVVDRQRQRAYLVGLDPGGRLYVLCADYSQDPAPLTLCYTDTLGAVGRGATLPVLTPQGHIAIVGGITDSNFYPFATALLLKVGPQADDEALSQAGSHRWRWPVAVLLLAAAAAGLALYYRRKGGTGTPTDSSDDKKDAETSAYAALMDSMETLMAGQKPYLNSELKVADVAAMLATNSRYVSDSIKAMRGCSFTQYVNGLRVDHAKQMLLSEPDRKIADVSTASGFANETSFFRTFKTVTGMPPREWMAQNSPSAGQ